MDITFQHRNILIAVGINLPVDHHPVFKEVLQQGWIEETASGTYRVTLAGRIAERSGSSLRQNLRWAEMPAFEWVGDGRRSMIVPGQFDEYIV